MNNIQRIELETKGIILSQNELSIYLEEVGLNPTVEYMPYNESNKVQIYQAALSILESVANNPTLMKSVKLDDMTVSDFADSIQSRIDQLERKVRTMKQNIQSANESSVFMLFDN
ncbi:hypothetical protein [Domibacillus epiphyticus]|uniref:Uncharacterized protein n=1 Tax=Domibacillus epiphyticus TaxID=1714355 RepID=A0A1V2A7I2_9BACI|nr:hypothetical protein [Domibacillus epiphyticus]OMP66890.1 hypothetical protein BTO28_09765 [Domibacillus epiphyticus]